MNIITENTRHFYLNQSLIPYFYLKGRIFRVENIKNGQYLAGYSSLQPQPTIAQPSVTLPPSLSSCGKSGRCGDRTCTKPSWEKQDCKRWPWSPDGNITSMYSKRLCSWHILSRCSRRPKVCSGRYILLFSGMG